MQAILLPVLLLLGLWNGGLGAAEADPPSEQEIAALIRQLGDDDFRQRDAASTKLFEIGPPATAQLKAARNDPDYEIRRRIRRLLPIIAESPAGKEDFDKRLQAFIDDTDGSKNTSLPGWERFREVAGQDGEARAFFVEMQRVEKALLELYQDDPQERDFFRQFEKSSQALTAGGRNAKPHPNPGATIAALIFVAGDETVTLPPKVNQLEGILRRPDFAQTYTTTNEALFRKLLKRWLGRKPAAEGLQQQVQRFQLLADLGFKEEGLAIAGDLLRQAAALEKTGEQGQQRMMSCIMLLCGIGKLGDRQHLDVVQPLLEDDTKLGNEKAQLRDLALAVAVQLSGRPASEFGLKQLDFSKGMMGVFGALQGGLYEEGQDREKALAKWQAWLEKNPQ